MIYSISSILFIEELAYHLMAYAYLFAVANLIRNTIL